MKWLLLPYIVTAASAAVIKPTNIIIGPVEPVTPIVDPVEPTALVDPIPTRRPTPIIIGPITPVPITPTLAVPPIPTPATLPPATATPTKDFCPLSGCYWDSQAPICAPGRLCPQFIRLVTACPWPYWDQDPPAGCTKRCKPCRTTVCPAICTLEIVCSFDPCGGLVFTQPIVVHPPPVVDTPIADPAIA